MKKIKADIAEIEKAMSQNRSINQAELELKDAYYEAEKDMIAKELLETYNAMPLWRDALQFKVGYRLGYLEAKEEDMEEHFGGSGEAMEFEAPAKETLERS